MECVNKILISRQPPLSPIKVPCGQCIACRLNRASSWSVRLMHEKQMSAVSYFVTLTYDDEHLPRVGNYSTLVKSDVQNFLKRFRKVIAPIKVRYYLCGEYGERYGRAHFHVIVFLDDVPTRPIQEFLESAWRNGFVHIGSVTFDSAAYVARYCTKLLTGHAKEWYTERNIEPEFSLMSRRPGIGASWLEKYGSEIKTHHNVIVKGRKVSPPRYYRDKVYEESDRNIVRSSFLNRIIEQVKEEMKFNESHPEGTYDDSVAEARDYEIKSRLQMKKRSKF